MCDLSFFWFCFVFRAEFFSSWTLKDRGVPLMPRGMTNYTNSCFSNAVSLVTSWGGGGGGGLHGQ